MSANRTTYLTIIGLKSVKTIFKIGKNNFLLL